MEAAGGQCSAADLRAQVPMNDLQHDRTPPEVLISQGYRRTANGEPGARPARPTGAASLLTARELDVLDGFATGFSDREIALRLMFFEPVVRAMRQSIYRNLGGPPQGGGRGVRALAE
jgi:DNA-binding NarL/FixJ family response regulator